MPLPCTITGSFTRDGEPVVGVLVRFTPYRLWVTSGGATWACLAPVVRLDNDGSFSCQVTPTNVDAIAWHYQVDSPAGRFLIQVPWSPTGHTLKRLINEHRVGPRPTYRR